MFQVFVLGASSVYGVGASIGWADLVKKSLHKKMYAEGGVGEKIEVFNFGKSGATIGFVKNTFPQLLDQFGRGGEIITIISVGRNNSKAVERPENFVSSIEEYSREMSDLLDMLKTNSTHVIAVGSGDCDETKTNPKVNPLTGGKSYFSNARTRSFQEELKKICRKKKYCLC